MIQISVEEMTMKETGAEQRVTYGGISKMEEFIDGRVGRQPTPAVETEPVRPSHLSSTIYSGNPTM